MTLRKRRQPTPSFRMPPPFQPISGQQAPLKASGLWPYCVLMQVAEADLYEDYCICRGFDTRINKFIDYEQGNADKPGIPVAKPYSCRMTGIYEQWQIYAALLPIQSSDSAGDVTSSAYRVPPSPVTAPIRLGQNPGVAADSQGHPQTISEEVAPLYTAEGVAVNWMFLECPWTGGTTTSDAPCLEPCICCVPNTPGMMEVTIAGFPVTCCSAINGVHQLPLATSGGCRWTKCVAEACEVYDTACPCEGITVADFTIEVKIIDPGNDCTCGEIVVTLIIASRDRTRVFLLSRLPKVLAITECCDIDDNLYGCVKGSMVCTDCTITVHLKAVCSPCPEFMGTCVESLPDFWPNKVGYRWRVTSGDWRYCAAPCGDDVWTSVDAAGGGSSGAGIVLSEVLGNRWCQWTSTGLTNCPCDGNPTTPGSAFLTISGEQSSTDETCFSASFSFMGDVYEIACFDPCATINDSNILTRTNHGSCCNSPLEVAVWANGECDRYVAQCCECCDDGTPNPIKIVIEGCPLFNGTYYLPLTTSQGGPSAHIGCAWSRFITDFCGDDDLLINAEQDAGCVVTVTFQYPASAPSVTLTFVFIPPDLTTCCDWNDEPLPLVEYENSAASPCNDCPELDIVATISSICGTGECEMTSPSASPSVSPSTSPSESSSPSSSASESASPSSSPSASPSTSPSESPSVSPSLSVSQTPSTSPSESPSSSPSESPSTSPSSSPSSTPSASGS